MIKNWMKKGLAFCLAWMMVGAGFLRINLSPAFAKGVEQPVYLVSYPRPEDPNRTKGNWGHNKMEFANGWTCGYSRFSTLRMMENYSGKICYCIEPGVDQRSGDKLTKYDEHYWDHYPAEYNQTISPDTIKVLLGRLFQYGYNGSVGTGWLSTNQGADSLAYAYATQLLMWEVIVGERDQDFQHVSTKGCHEILEIVSDTHPLRSKILKHYKAMETKMFKHMALPSFMSRDKNKAHTVKMKYIKGKYILQLTDDHHVLSKFRFSSTDSRLKFSVQEHVLEISSTAPLQSPVSIRAERKDKVTRCGLVTWTDGKHGGIQDTVTSYVQPVMDPVSAYLNVKAEEGSIKIIKSAEDGKIKDVTFQVTGNNETKTVHTDQTGIAVLEHLKPGKYEISEVTAAEYVPQQTQKAEVLPGTMPVVYFNNQLKRGSLTVQKTAEDGFLEGHTFHLYGHSENGTSVSLYAKTDRNGAATFDGVLISGDEPYIVEEVETAVRYVVPVQKQAKVMWDEVTAVPFRNAVKKFTLTLTKSDFDTMTSQGNGTLKGASYGVFRANHLVDTYQTDENGSFTTKEYPCGTDWTVKELAPSDGYLLDPTVYKVGADPKRYTAEHNRIHMAVREKVIKGTIELVKYTDVGIHPVDMPEQGAEFEVFLKSAGSYAKAKDTERFKMICNENGIGRTKLLPYGIYTVHQIKSWPGRHITPDFDVYVNQNGKTYSYPLHNPTFRGKITLKKVDAEAIETRLKGAVFTVYEDKNGNDVFEPGTDCKIGMLTETEAGRYEMVNLPFGRYFVQETEAPLGYHLDPRVYTAEVDEDGKVIEICNAEDNLFVNHAMKGTLKIVKTSDDGKVQGFAFRITSGEGFDEIAETDENGIIWIENLRIGTYYISELENAASEKYDLPEGREVLVKTDAVITVSMHNHLKPDNPDSGSGKHTGIWVGLAVVSSVACLIAAVLLKRKKK